MPRLSTHVLDTARGLPAAGVKVELYRVSPRALLMTVVTNADGRALLSESVMEPGVYELTFQAGDYLGVERPAFLDEIVIRFGITDGSANLHVPLLLAPFGYSTYRGS